MNTVLTGSRLQGPHCVRETGAQANTDANHPGGRKEAQCGGMRASERGLSAVLKWFPSHKKKKWINKEHIVPFLMSLRPSPLEVRPKIRHTPRKFSLSEVYSGLTFSFSFS